MKIYSGKYGKDSIRSNNLAENQLLFPQIASAITRQYPQYSTSYFVDGTGRFAKEDTIGNNKFQWFVLGRSNRPSTLTGTNTGNGLALTQFSVELEENYLNPNDCVKFADGNKAVVMTEPTVGASGGYLYQFKLLTADPLAFVSAAALAAGTIVGKFSTLFGEGSKTGYENHIFPDLYTNYLGIQRKSRSITGSAMTDITWIESGGSKLWYFTDEMLCRQDFMWENEMDDWYADSTMDANGVCQVLQNGVPLVKGDGILKQISAANKDTYGGILTEKRISDFIAQLGLNTGMKNSHWLVYTGTAGKIAFTEAMKNFVMPAGNLIYNADTGKEMAIGADFTTYYAYGHKITLVHNPIFDDPNLHGSNIDPISGRPKESFRMVFLNFGQTKDGSHNIERKVKGAGKVNRGMITKYITGMVNPFDQDAVLAANGDDGFEVQMLRDAGIIVRNTLCCGELSFA